MEMHRFKGHFMYQKRCLQLIKENNLKKKSTAIDLYLFCLESSSCSNCISVLRAYTISPKGTHKIIKYLFLKSSLMNLWG